MLLNECSWPNMEIKYSTNDVSINNNTAVNTVFTRSTKSYTRTFANGIIEIFEGEYWKMSMKKLIDSEEGVSEIWECSSCESEQQSFLDDMP